MAVIASTSNQARCLAKTYNPGRILIESRELGTVEFDLSRDKKTGDQRMYVLLDLCYDVLQRSGLDRGLKLSILGIKPR